MKELIVGKTYTTNELQKFFSVSASTWSHKRNEYLDNLSLYYEYEVKYRGRNTDYLIVKKLGDYQKPPRKKDKAMRDAVYEAQIVDVIKWDNYQTASNVARIITTREPIQNLHHSNGTVQEYTRLRMRAMFGKKPQEGGTHGTIIEKEWCRLDGIRNQYIPMTDEAISAFYELFSDIRSVNQQAELDALNDYHIHLITKEELADRISDISLNGYLSARKEFCRRYGYYPIKVPVYGLDDLDVVRFDREEEQP